MAKNHMAPSGRVAQRESAPFLIAPCGHPRKLECNAHFVPATVRSIAPPLFPISFLPTTPIFQVNISCCRFEILRHHHRLFIQYQSAQYLPRSFPSIFSFLFFFLSKIREKISKKSHNKCTIAWNIVNLFRLFLFSYQQRRPR